jgi:Flp pilus assembly pilin Flp
MLTPLSLIRDETGSATLEYGLLVASIALVAIISVQTFGLSVASLFRPGPAAINPWGR